MNSYKKKHVKRPQQNYKVFIRKQQERINVVYAIFAKLGVSKKEFLKLEEEIKIDSNRTSTVLVNLFLCVLIKRGLTVKHIIALSRSLGHPYFRSNNLKDRVLYLTKIVNEIKKESFTMT